MTHQGEQGHTPGGWEVWSSLYTGMAAAVVRSGSDPLETVAEVRNFRDARLIAAAPAMLEALAELRRVCADIPAIERSPRFAAANQKALAAVALATQGGGS